MLIANNRKVLHIPFIHVNCAKTRVVSNNQKNSRGFYWKRNPINRLYIQTTKVEAF